MTEEREVWVENNLYHVVLSDERETLLAAKAAGRVVVGLLRPDDRGGAAEDLSAARYLVEDPETETGFLERVVRRELGLPWIIAESDRIVVREFTASDISQVMQEPEDTEADAVFYTPELLESYIQNQYGFYECGMWAVVRKSDGRLVGKAGVTLGEGRNKEDPCLELGYHIFTPYRKQGYAKEACRLILDYVEKEYLTENDGSLQQESSAVTEVWARTKPENTASACLLQSLGFDRDDEPGKSSPEAETCDREAAECDIFWKLRRVPENKF